MKAGREPSSVAGAGKGRMRVLHVGKYYPPHQGGIETVTAALAEESARRGHEVTVICASDSRATVEETVRGVRVLRLACLGELFSQPIVPGLWGALRREARAADLLHFHAPNPLAELCALFLPGPRFVTFHADVVRQRGLLTLYSLLQRRFLSGAARIFVASAALRRTSPALAGVQDKVAVVPFGIRAGGIPAGTGDGSAGGAPAGASTGPGGGAYVLFVGRLVSYKGLPVLLRAMQSLPFHLLVVGDGPERGRLEALALALGCRERVHFRGSVPEEELPALFLGARVVVLPSVTRAEAFGMALVEAMAWGRPVISSALDTGVSEVNEHGKTGLVVPVGDAAALASAIAQVFADDALCARFSRNGLKKFHDTYTAAAMAEQVLSEYESHAGRGPARREGRAP